MARKPVVVTEADWEKDKENVQRIETSIPGFPDAEPLVSYVKVEYTDDVTEKPAEGVETYSFSLPVEAKEEVEVIGEDGEPEKNTDGSTKLKVETYFKTVHYDVDMSPASREKLIKALAPFTKNARVKSTPVVTASAASASKSSHDLNAIRAWAKENNHEVADKGRIAGKVIEAYYAATGKTNPDKG
ncbi:histone-like nucleoid-structuring protein Lsr2 [Streptomyces sp. NPDC005385]|uniref:Lsr2 family DNA-binding protein n=1 Tax=Streptomyces sp. NPDC005385 TaxID=3157039 RepID=UPI0033B4FC63